MNTVEIAIYEKKYTNMLKDMVLGALAETNARVFLFGSRARNQTRPSSDFDIGIERLPVDKFETFRQNLQDKIEESIIPHKVDIVNFDLIDTKFKALAQKDIDVWKP